MSLIIEVGRYVACGIEKTETYSVGILRTAILVIVGDVSVLLRV